MPVLPLPLLGPPDSVSMCCNPTQVLIFPPFCPLSPPRQTSNALQAHLGAGPASAPSPPRPWPAPKPTSVLILAPVPPPPRFPPRQSLHALRILLPVPSLAALPGNLCVLLKPCLVLLLPCPGCTTSPEHGVVTSPCPHRVILKDDSSFPFMNVGLCGLAAPLHLPP